MTTQLATRSESITRSVCALFLCLLCQGISHAQDEASESSRTEKAGYYLKTEDGTLIRLSTMGVSDAEIEKLIRDGRIEVPPQFAISAVNLTGRVEGKLAYLDAEITVRLNVEDEKRWVSVPIAMNEGKLVGTWKYEGSGAAIYDRKRTTETGIRHWFIRGSGRHKLKLPLVVQVREPQHLRNSLRIRLPDAAASSLVLNVPARTISVVPPKDAGQKTTRTESGTRIELWGLGTQFAMQWDVRPDVATSKPLIRSRSTLSVNLTQDPFVIRAKQKLILQQGSIKTVEVQLPAGFGARNPEPQLVDPTGRVTAIESIDDTRFKLTFSEPLSEDLDLDWTLAARDPVLARKWTFTGLQVVGAQEQTTELELTPPEGVAVQPVRQIGVQRRNTGSTQSDQRITRCRFLSPESEFTVELRDVEPFYTVTPRMVLLFSENQLRLEARFRIRLLRGSLQQLNLSWPGLIDEGWKLLPAPAGENLTDWASAPASSNDSISLDLLTRAGGTFEIGVSAVRNQETLEAFPISLPSITSETRQPATLVIASPQNLDVEFQAIAESTSEPIPIDTLMTAGISVPETFMQRRAYIVRSEARQFSASLRTRERQLSSQTSLQLDVKEDGINVEQTIEYQLDFDFVTDLRFTVPPEIEPTVSLDDVVLRLADSGPGTRRYSLPEPRSGSFNVTVRYRVALNDDASNLNLPLLLSSDCPTESIRLGVESGAASVLTPIGGWEPVFSRQLEAEWITTNASEPIALTLASRLNSSARRFAIPRALVQTKIVGTGVEGRVSYVIKGEFRQLDLETPEDIRIQSVNWNGRRLDESQWTTDRLIGPRMLTIQQSQRSGTGTLSINYRSTAPPLSWLRTASATCPTMPDDTPVEDVVWQVILPTGEHLADWETNASPCFSWIPGSFGWSRQPTEEFQDLGTWLNPNGEFSSAAQTAAGNAYAFQLPTLRQGIRISTVDQSFLLLFGSGIAFLAAFLIIRFSPRRFVIAVPAVGLLVSLASLKYAAALQLLLQPALLGVLLAVIAYQIDRRRYRRGYGAFSMDRTRRSTVAVPPTASVAPPSQPASVGSSS